MGAVAAEPASLMSFFRRPGGREALWLTLGLWTACYLVFLAPAVLEGKLTAWRAGMFGLIVLAGMALSTAFLPDRKSTRLNSSPH